MCMKKTKDAKIGYNWRCLNKICNKYQTTISIFAQSFLEKFNSKARKALEALIHMSADTKPAKIANIKSLNKNTLVNVKKEINTRIRLHFARNEIKLGGPGIIVHCDETMLNHKVKAHRGRSPSSQVWAFVILESQPALKRICHHRTK